MIDLDQFPVDRDIHTLADFVELMTLLSSDRLVSRDDFDDCIRDLSVNDRRAAINAEAVDDVFMQLTWRQQAFGEGYPFVVTHRGKALSICEILPAHATYVYLLLCANLPLLMKGESHHTFTSSFERIVGVAVTHWWQPPAHVKPFGTGQSAYTGAKWDRLNALAQDLGGHGTYSVNSFRDRDSGDGGIDHVAWRTFDAYEANNKSTALFQCACSRAEWPTKQNDASYTRLSPMLHVAPQWQVVMCIPQCFRDNRGRWAYNSEVSALVMLDRLRLMHLLPSSFELHKIDPPKNFWTFFHLTKGGALPNIWNSTYDGLH